MESKVKSMFIIFFDMKGIVHKDFVLAGQTVNFGYYCDVLRRLSENGQRFRPEFWRRKNWMLSYIVIMSYNSNLSSRVQLLNWLT
jgi:hypothetical protein